MTEVSVAALNRQLRSIQDGSFGRSEYPQEAWFAGLDLDEDATVIKGGFAEFRLTDGTTRYVWRWKIPDDEDWGRIMYGDLGGFLVDQWYPKPDSDGVMWFGDTRKTAHDPASAGETRKSPDS